MDAVRWRKIEPARRSWERDPAVPAPAKLDRGRFLTLVGPVVPRPLFERELTAATGEGDETIDFPAPDETVTDPLVVAGSLPWRRRLEHRKEPVLMVDGTPVSSLAEAHRAGGRFVLTGPIPHLSEGAHLLWLRDGAGSHRGWGHRRIFFRRPDGDAGARRLRASRLAALRVAANGRSPLTATVAGGGSPGGLRVRRFDRGGGETVAVVDLSELAPGAHRLVLRAGGTRIWEVEIERLGGWAR